MRFLRIMFKIGLFLFVILGTAGGFYIGVRLVEQEILAQDDYIYFVLMGVGGFLITSIISGFGAYIVKMERDVEKLKRAIALDEQDHI